MERDKFIDLIGRLETYSQSNPSRYRFQVGLLAGLGYAYLLAVVVVLLAIVYFTLMHVQFNTITLKVALIPLALAGLVLRSLWISIPEPDGKELRYQQAPGLFTLVEEVRSALNGPKVHRILLSDEFNAGIVQIPRFGMFGWSRNYLLIGLPLMKALSPPEFKAVLAHEFGHLSGKHGRFSGWIYRLRLSWIVVTTRVQEEKQYASFMFDKFLSWYAPFFNAYSFVLARMQEYEADAQSVELSGREVSARALVTITLKERSLAADFWREFYSGARDQAQPPKDPFSLMLSNLDHPIESAKAEKWFVQALDVKTGYDDTHPALAERLGAMGFQRERMVSADVVDALVKTELVGSAASYYLPEISEDLILHLNRLWREQLNETWRDRHNRLQKARQRLDELEKKAKQSPLTLEEQWELAANLFELDQRAAAMPYIKANLEANPNNATATFLVGTLLLEQQDPTGTEYLERSMKLDPSLTVECCELLYDFHHGQGRRDEALACRARAKEFYEKVERATDVSTKDRFEPHGLSEVDLRGLEEQLAKTRGLHRAYLVRKVLDQPDEPFYVLGVVASYTWRDGSSGRDSEALLADLVATIRSPSPLVFVALEGENAKLEGKFRLIAGASVFVDPDLAVQELV